MTSTILYLLLIPGSMMYMSSTTPHVEVLHPELHLLQEPSLEAACEAQEQTRNSSVWKVTAPKSECVQLDNMPSVTPTIGTVDVIPVGSPGDSSPPSQSYTLPIHGDAMTFSSAAFGLSKVKCRKVPGKRTERVVVDEVPEHWTEGP